MKLNVSVGKFKDIIINHKLAQYNRIGLYYCLNQDGEDKKHSDNAQIHKFKIELIMFEVTDKD